VPFGKASFGSHTMDVPREGGSDFETQYKWNSFEKLMIPSN